MKKLTTILIFVCFILHLNTHSTNALECYDCYGTKNFCLAKENQKVTTCDNPSLGTTYCMSLDTGNFLSLRCASSDSCDNIQSGSICKLCNTNLCNRNGSNGLKEVTPGLFVTFVVVFIKFFR